MDKTTLFLIIAATVCFAAFSFFGGGFWVFIMVFFVPGVGLGIILLFFCWFLVKKYRESRSIIYLFIPAVIVFLVFLSAVIFSPPVRGRVIDSITGKSIAGVSVEQRIHILSIVINPGGEFSRVWRVYSAKTDENGFFYFPLRVNMTIPLYNIFAGMTFAVSLENGLADRYNDITYSYFDGKELGRSLSYSTACLSCAGGYEDSTYTEIPWLDYNKLKNKELFLIPKVKEIEECGKVIDDKLISECKEQNSERLAEEKKDASLCVFSGWRANFCVARLAEKLKNPDLCKWILDFQDDKDDYDDCLRNTAQAMQDVGFCNSISESEWKVGAKEGFCYKKSNCKN